MKQDSKVITKPLRVLKIGTCSTLSAKKKGTLTYYIGCNSYYEIHFSIHKNSGSGYFSQEWISLKALQETFAKWEHPLTSHAITPLFEGKSVNTPAFLMAALKHEGLLKDHPEKQRCFVSVDPQSFIDAINLLINGKVDLKVDTNIKLAITTKKVNTKPEKAQS